MPRGPLRLRGVAWQRAQDGTWDRHMLRVYQDGTPYWSRTVRVEDERLPFCLYCLSPCVTAVGVTPVSELWECHACDIGQFEILVE